MLYSSGTTGHPKGILPELTGAPFGTGLGIDSTMRDVFGFGSDTVYLSPGPLYHATPLGWTMGTVRNGGTAIVMEQFDAEATLSAPRPIEVKERMNDKGWSTLGDLGHVDEDGYLYLSARRTDLILSGGVNIYPQEIEDALTMHPAVLDVAVIGLPDDEMGQRVRAVVTPVEGAVADDDLATELIDCVREKLAHCKAPRTVEFGAVPRLPSGKILRRALLSRGDAPGVTQ
jgi:acyl-CoA synthetase (AMP-forming)/AMP-acid ligase II